MSEQMSKQVAKAQLGIAVPGNVASEVAENCIDLMLGYGLEVGEDFWSNVEMAMSAALELGDAAMYGRLATGEADDTDMEQEYISANVEPRSGMIPASISDTANLEVAGLDTCYFHGFELASRCQCSDCPQYSDQAYRNCGFNPKEPDMLSFEVIAHHMQEDADTIREVFVEASHKVRQSQFGLYNIVEPKWDVALVESHCALCGTEIGENNLSDDEHTCLTCSEEFTPAGAYLLRTFRRPLSEIIAITASKYDNFNSQALVLGITSAQLHNLYLLTGISRRCTNAASRSYGATHRRPGKVASQLDQQEYLAMEAITSRQVFGDFSRPVCDRLRSLVSMVAGCGIKHEPTFI